MDFDSTFQALTGFLPFGWQRRLHDEHFVRGDIPAALDLPTGLGKTSVMAVWLIARAQHRPLPRRLVYVVDRRAVVDQATEVAMLLAAQAPGALELDALSVSTLRGQHADNRRWLEDPATPAIIVGTIDMVGSRLLFEGYGVSRGMRPNHAGLLGADTLVILDEAHLCPPFEALLRSIQTDATLKPAPESGGLVPPLRLMALSATGPSGATAGTFRLTGADQTEPAVAERLTAAKRLRAADLPTGRKLDDVLAEKARALVTGGPARVLVFCNSRDTAEKVLDRLRKGWRKGEDPSVEALVGARRVRERQALATRLHDLGFTAGTPAPPPAPCFLVATSAGEVGVDLDADHMVCDLVASERMIQRLGRVNRRGGAGRIALVDVVAAPFDKEKPELALPRLAVLKAPFSALPLDPADDRHDASPSALADLKRREPALLAQASTTPPLHPPMTRALADAWSMTSLPEHPGRPDPGPWLRGWQADDEPQATVLWRRWLPWRTDAEGKAIGDRPDAKAVESFFDAARPHLTELLQAPADEVAETLIDRAKAVGKTVTKAVKGLPPEAPAVILLTQAREFHAALTIGDLGRTARAKLEALVRWRIVVVSAALGGVNADGLLDGKAAGWSMETPWPGCLDAGWSGDEREQAGIRVLGPGEDDHSDDWRTVHRFPWSDLELPEPTFLTVATWRKAGANQAGDLAVQRTAQRLDRHHDWTRIEAARIAQALDLPPAYAAMLETAAALHDAGKNRPLWQRAMGAPDDAVYAKTTGAGMAGGAANRLRIGGEVYRHEFGSLADAEAAGSLAGLPPDLRDLALHLIAAHHGNARPLIAAVDPASPPSRSGQRAQAAAMRFADLQRRWGPWGLAWWEALLRAADRRASKRLDGTPRTGNEG